MIWTIVAWASSTAALRTWPSTSISSTRSWRARSDTLDRTLSRTTWGDALERRGQDGGVDLPQHHLHRAVLEADDVGEDEQPRLDLLGQLRVVAR